MDAFAQTLMKDAVNCDKHSDLQNSVNQLDFEYGLCCRGWLPLQAYLQHVSSIVHRLMSVLAAHQGACPFDMHCSVHLQKVCACYHYSS